MYTYLFIASINNPFLILVLYSDCFKTIQLLKKVGQDLDNLSTIPTPHSWFRNFNCCNYSSLQRDHFRGDHGMRLSLKWFCTISILPWMKEGTEVRKVQGLCAVDSTHWKVNNLRWGSVLLQSYYCFYRWAH